MLLAGEFEGRVDSRGRLVIPAAFADELKDGAVVARGFERCVTVYSARGWERISGEIREMRAVDAATRRLARVVFASAEEHSVDRQGRILLPERVRRHAGVDREVVVVGAGDAIEIWSPEGWAEEVAKLEAAVDGEDERAA